jgi:hypothetical protein
VLIFSPVPKILFSTPGSNLYFLGTTGRRAPSMHCNTKDGVNCRDWTRFPDLLWQEPSYGHVGSPSNSNLLGNTQTTSGDSRKTHKLAWVEWKQHMRELEHGKNYTPLVVVSHAHRTLRISTTATDSVNSMFRRKMAVWSALYSARENSIGVITDIRHMNNCRINDISIKNLNNKIIEIQIIISIVRVSEHLSKMLVLSGVFNTRILDSTN